MKQGAHICQASSIYHVLQQPRETEKVRLGEAP